MHWKKLGKVFTPGTSDTYSHAMFPVCDILDEEKSLIRIYYTHRDESNYGFPTYLDAQLIDESITVTYNHHKPIIERASVGCFDDSGINVTSLVSTPKERVFFYYGWNLGVTVPFRNSIGIASVNDTGDKLTRMHEGPIIDRSRQFPHLCATPWVLYDDNIFKMWFASGEAWKMVDNVPHVACHIGYAESTNGVDWIRQVEPCVAHGEYADHVISTPCVLKEKNTYKMWYSYRGEKYRIGYAESQDGKQFVRKDSEVGISVSHDDWDSEMICYPNVFRLNGKYYMLYCGNGYGKTGLGLAVLNS